MTNTINNNQSNSLLSSRAKTAVILSAVLGIAIAIFPQFAKQMPQLKWIQTQNVKAIALFLGGSLAIASLSFFLSNSFFNHKKNILSKTASTLQGKPKINSQKIESISNENTELNKTVSTQKQTIDKLQKKLLRETNNLKALEKKSNDDTNRIKALDDKIKSISTNKSTKKENAIELLKGNIFKEIKSLRKEIDLHKKTDEKYENSFIDSQQALDKSTVNTLTDLLGFEDKQAIIEEIKKIELSKISKIYNDMNERLKNIESKLENITGK